MRAWCLPLLLTATLTAALGSVSSCGGRSAEPGTASGGTAGAGGSGGGGSICTLPAEGGMCNAYFPRWWFNAETQRCEPFVWGGCGGNGNNFESAEACVAGCAAQSIDDVCQAVGCAEGDVCVYFSELAGCGTPCIEGSGCPNGTHCSCGSSCSGCDDCALVCRST
ncbi:MAG: BPTI/Kunitz-type proteinase inhibitor domain-containing protein [Polyangiaceae bacterium]